MTAQDALQLVAQVGDLYVAKGKNVVHVNLAKDRPDEQTLLKLLLGPSGNLRAPTIRTGRTLLVGFDEAIYTRVLG